MDSFIYMEELSFIYFLCQCTVENGWFSFNKKPFLGSFDILSFVFYKPQLKFTLVETVSVLLFLTAA